MTASDHGSSPIGQEADVGVAAANKIVDAIYADIRNRKLLKLLWDEDGREAGMIAREVYPMDVETQAEIHARWVVIAYEHIARLTTTSTAGR